MKVTECMTTEPTTIEADASLVEAAHVMLDCETGFLPVLDEGQLVGVVTDRDLVVRGLAESRSPFETPVHELMSIEVVCCLSDRTVEEAKALMEEYGVRRLPVIDDQRRLLGVLSRKQLGLADAPRKAPVKVTFHKQKTDSYGRPHKLAVKSVYITGTKDKQEALAAAVKHYQEEQGTAWSNAANEIEIRGDKDDNSR